MGLPLKHYINPDNSWRKTTKELSKREFSICVSTLEVLFIPENSWKKITKNQIGLKGNLQSVGQGLSGTTHETYCTKE